MKDYNTHFNSMDRTHQLEKSKKRKRHLAKVKSYNNLKQLVEVVGTKKVYHAYASGREVSLYKKLNARICSSVKKDINRIIRRSNKYKMNAYNNGLYKKIKDYNDEIDL